MAHETKLTSLHGFTLLPKELRLQIWAYTHPRGRNVVAGLKLSIPSALHACHESRVEALKVFAPLWTGAASDVYLIPRYTFVDFLSDTIVIDERFIQYSHDKDLQRMRKLAIKVAHWPSYVDRSLFNLCKYVRQLRVLVELEVIVLIPQNFSREGSKLRFLEKLKAEFIKCNRDRPNYVSPRLRLIDVTKMSENVLAAIDWPGKTTGTDRFFTHDISGWHGERFVKGERAASICTLAGRET